MDRIQQIACESALRDMIKGGYINICTIDKIGDISGIPVKCSPAYKTLSLLHCKNIGELPSELRCEIPRLLFECLGTNPFEKVEKIEVLRIEVVLKEESPPPTILPKRKFLGIF